MEWAKGTATVMLNMVLSVVKPHRWLDICEESNSF